MADLQEALREQAAYRETQGSPMYAELITRIADDALEGGVCAATFPVPVARRRAVDAVRSLELAPGTTNVVWHSAAWQYFGAEEQDAITARFEELGARATAGCRSRICSSSPYAGLPAEHEFLVVLRSWPGGRRRVLATAAPHGFPMTWE